LVRRADPAVSHLRFQRILNLTTRKTFLVNIDF
jgi:hypothetical protein